MNWIGAGPRILAHECSGWRSLWHTLSGVHIDLAREDLNEAIAAANAARDRLFANWERSGKER